MGIKRGKDFKEKEVKDNGNTKDTKDACESMRNVRKEPDNSCRQCFFYMQELCDAQAEREGVSGEA